MSTKTAKLNFGEVLAASKTPETEIGIWEDDAQVAVLRSTKMYEAGMVGCWITIEQMTSDDHAREEM